MTPLLITLANTAVIHSLVLLLVLFVSTVHMTLHCSASLSKSGIPFLVGHVLFYIASPLVHIEGMYSTIIVSVFWIRKKKKTGMLLCRTL